MWIPGQPPASFHHNLIIHNKNDIIIDTGFPLSCLQKIAVLFQDPYNIFQDFFVAQQCLNIQTKSSYLLYTYSKVPICTALYKEQLTSKVLRYGTYHSFTCHPHVYQYHPAQNVYQRNCLVNNTAGILCTFIYTWCSVQKAVFQF